jgi:hypothetical protein
MAVTLEVRVGCEFECFSAGSQIAIPQPRNARISNLRRCLTVYETGHRRGSRGESRGTRVSSTDLVGFGRAVGSDDSTIRNRTDSDRAPPDSVKEQSFNFRVPMIEPEGNFCCLGIAEGKCWRARTASTPSAASPDFSQSAPALAHPLPQQGFLGPCQYTRYWLRASKTLLRQILARSSGDPVRNPG